MGCIGRVLVDGFTSFGGCIMKLRRSWVIALAFTVLVAVQASAGPSITVYGTHTDDTLISGGDLTDVRMIVELMVNSGVATMTFTNASIGPADGGLETSAVFKEIVVDLYDNDTATAILWNVALPADTATVAYTAGDSNGLPGYHGVTAETPDLLELQAKPAPPTKGLGPGESLSITFDTILADGSDIFDYLAAFGGGSDGPDYTIGFHAISASTVGGGSLSGIYTVPEPTTIGLISLSGLLLVCLRRRQRPGE
jgi:hypothetical protein